MSSRQLEDQMEREGDQKVADYLGLTYEEYISLEPNVEEVPSDDGLIYRYLVTFEATIPPYIAAKIRGLDDDEVSLPPGFFEEEDDDQDWPQGWPNFRNSKALARGLFY